MGTNNVWDTLMTYVGNSTFWIIFLLSLIFLMNKMEAKLKKKIVLVFAGAFIFVFNDISRSLIGKLTDVSTYYRFIWMIPLVLVVAIAATKVIMEAKGWGKLVPIVAILLCLKIIGGSYFSIQNFRLPENKYDVSGEVIQVCELIEQDKKIEQPVVAFDMTTQLTARPYDASLIWGISREAYIYFNNIGFDQGTGMYIDEETLIKTVNNGIQGDVGQLEIAMDNMGIDYLVIATFYNMDDYLEQANCSVVGRTGIETVYRYNHE